GDIADCLAQSCQPLPPAISYASHRVGVAHYQGRLAHCPSSGTHSQTESGHAIRMAAFVALKLDQTKYFSIFSPASCLLLSQLAIRPRPDHVSFVFGSRYFAFTRRFRLFEPSLPSRTPGGRPRRFGASYPSAASSFSSSARFTDRASSCACCMCW